MLKSEREELMRLITPVQQWLADNLHPHCTLIVDNISFELLEGIFACPNNENVKIPD